MNAQLGGIHHVTAIVGDPQENVDFYTGVLGLRLIKTTVNFDDPHTYHLYFGDTQGQPGTIITFFPWAGGRPGTRGVGQVSGISLAIPEQAVDYWRERLDSFGVRASAPATRFGQQVISLYDPAGLLLELVTQPDASADRAWADGPIAPEYAIRGIAGITMTVAERNATAAMLTDVLGFRHVGDAANRHRYALADGGSGTLVDLVVRPDVPYGQMGVGVVHHIAWRVADDAAQAAFQRVLRENGVGVTEVRDRQYFRSIYFQEPGRVIFEIATDEPGFAIDEPVASLGTALKLPPWLEPQRASLERVLPPLVRPTVEQAEA